MSSRLYILILIFDKGVKLFCGEIRGDIEVIVFIIKVKRYFLSYVRCNLESCVDVIMKIYILNFLEENYIIKYFLLKKI